MVVDEDSDYEEEEARVAALIKQGTMGCSLEIIASDQTTPDLSKEELEVRAYERSKRFLANQT
jgi:hypothetical protein